MSTTTDPSSPESTAPPVVTLPGPGAGAAVPPAGSARPRSLAPDVARGLMLLLIALAHAPAFVSEWGVGWLDRCGVFVRALVAENLARSMFIFLFGYGLGQMLSSRTAAGGDWRSVRGILRRRGLV